MVSFFVAGWPVGGTQSCAQIPLHSWWERADNCQLVIQTALKLSKLLWNLTSQLRVNSELLGNLIKFWNCTNRIMRIGCGNARHLARFLVLWIDRRNSIILVLVLVLQGRSRSGVNDESLPGAWRGHKATPASPPLAKQAQHLPSKPTFDCLCSAFFSSSDCCCSCSAHDAPNVNFPWRRD